MRNVDIVAVVLLLLAMAIYAHVSRFVSFEVNTARHVIVLPRDHRFVRVPPVPKIPFTRD